MQDPDNPTSCFDGIYLITIERNQTKPNKHHKNFIFSKKLTKK